MIRRVDPCSPISKVLGPHDIITAFDGTPISNDGTVAFRSGERISFTYLVSQVCLCEGGGRVGACVGGRACVSGGLGHGCAHAHMLKFDACTYVLACAQGQ